MEIFNAIKFKKGDSETMKSKNFFLFALLFCVVLLFNYSLTGCINDGEKKMAETITPGLYERSAKIDSHSFIFLFHFSRDKNFTALYFRGETLIGRDSGFWEQQENSLCIYSTNISGCEEVRKIKDLSFEIWDKELSSWVIFKRTS